MSSETRCSECETMHGPFTESGLCLTCYTLTIARAPFASVNGHGSANAVGPAESRAEVNGRELPSPPPGPSFRCTDLGNAERLVSRHGSDLRYVPGLGWLVWDGRRWAADGDGEVRRRAKETVRAIYREAADAPSWEDREELAAWATKSEAEPRLAAMVNLAATESAVVARTEELDRDQLLLNVANGTVDLTSGELRAHDRRDLITKLAPVDYDTDATDLAWKLFLERVAGELEPFLRRAAGYSITGDTGEEVLFFLHGPEATGKSTFVEAVKRALGDYAATADFETFLSRRADGGPRADIARLAGARVVTSLEVDDGKRLAEGLVKSLTGGDTVTARFLYREAFEFRPAFKLWLAANARPKVSATDGAIWRRIVQVPFTQTIPEHERDPDLKRYLLADTKAQKAILSWTVKGCVEWQRHGLDVPAQVRDYTAEYRSENDPLRAWLEDCCELDPEATTAARVLRESYEGWCAANGERPVGNRTWGPALTSRGLRTERTGSTRLWCGISVREMTQ